MDQLAFWQEELNQCEIEQDEIDAEIIRSRNEEIRQLEQDMVCLNDIFRDLAVMIGHQGELLDVAEKHVEEAVVNSEEGVEHLQKAEDHSIAARQRGWLLKGALAFSGITVGGLGLTVISPVIGIITAGAGITGIVSCIGIAIKKRN